MRRIIFLALAVFLVACIPIIASGHDAMTANYQTTMFATIPTTTLDANTGATGPGFTSCSAVNDVHGATTAMTGDDYYVPISNFCLRAKGSGHGAGVTLNSASALVSIYNYCHIGNHGTATANNHYQNMPAGTDGGTRTSQRRTILRC